jgi:NAD(P)-dependent dehydrogenase (short-subunit alcohol dehydrogenase family)
VTGGSDGIGKGIVAALLDMGAEVYFCGRGIARGEAAERQLGGKSHFLPCDLRDLGAIETMIRSIKDRAGRLDYLVNNAGMDPSIAFAETTVEQFTAIIETDLRAYYFVTQYALPLLEDGEGKAIVNIGTTNYEKGIMGMTAYNSAKAGILGLTRSLARELGMRGMRVNLASPGWIVTDKQVNDRGMGREAMDHLKHSQCVRETIYPEHVASLVVFLLSKAATGLSGQNIIVDGGQCLQ